MSARSTSSRRTNPFDSSYGLTNIFVGNRDANWLAIDATLTRRFFLTVSPDIFHTVVRNGDDAYTVWTKINGLFTDNKLQRIVFLQQEFFGCHQNDSTIDAFCLRLKTLSDELNDVGFKVADGLLLSTLTAGLKEHFGNAASNLTLMANPTYERAVAYLRLEDRRLKNLRNRAAHTALAAGLSRGAPTTPPAPRTPVPAQHPLPPPAQPPPQPPRNDGNGGNSRRGRGGQCQGGGKGGGGGQPPQPRYGG
nr:uncharacterized protein LOC109749788 [Aegilops tauschii subsp. strangulata]